MRILFVNRFYWPDEPATAQLLTDLAEGLAARGHTVEVVTGPSERAGAERTERHGVRIHRLRGTRWGRRSLAGRAVDFVTFLAGTRRQLARLARPGDAVVALTDPPLLGTAAWRAVRDRGVRFWHWNQDVYPEVAIALLGSHPLLRWMLGLLRGPRDRAWHEAAGCAVLGRDMAGLVARAGVPPARIATIANWAPAGVAANSPVDGTRLREEWGLAGAFVVGYSGNLGRVHDLACILEVAAVLRDEPRIVFLFVGDGAQRPALERAAAARGLRQVQFRPPQPRDRLDETLALPDVHLVTLRGGCEATVFPSKLYGIAAAGRPAWFIGPAGCELAEIVEAHGFGRAFTPDAPVAVAASLRELASDPAASARLREAAGAFHRANGGAARAVKQWERLLERSSVGSPDPRA